MKAENLFSFDEYIKVRLLQSSCNLLCSCLDVRQVAHEGRVPTDIGPPHLQSKQEAAAPA